MVDYAPDSKAVEAQLRDAIRDTSFSDYNRVKLAVRLMGLFDVRNANLSEMKAVWDALQSIEDKALSPAHRTMAYIYFGRGLLVKLSRKQQCWLSPYRNRMTPLGFCYAVLFTAGTLMMTGRGCAPC